MKMRQNNSSLQNESCFMRQKPICTFPFPHYSSLFFCESWFHILIAAFSTRVIKILKHQSEWPPQSSSLSTQICTLQMFPPLSLYITSFSCLCPSFSVPCYLCHNIPVTGSPRGSKERALLIRWMRLCSRGTSAGMLTRLLLWHSDPSKKYRGSGWTHLAHSLEGLAPWHWPVAITLCLVGLCAVALTPPYQ